TENETARLDATDCIDSLCPPRRGQRVHAFPERARVGQKWRDVLEQHAGLREIRNVADMRDEARAQRVIDRCGSGQRVQMVAGFRCSGGAADPVRSPATGARSIPVIPRTTGPASSAKMSGTPTAKIGRAHV